MCRRNDSAKWSKSVDRHLDTLVEEDTLQKISQDLYYYPKLSVIGKTPPEEEFSIRSFLKDDRFLLTLPSPYNNLGIGTTQFSNHLFFVRSRFCYHKCKGNQSVIRNSF